jgi:hypothetical protein
MVLGKFQATAIFMNRQRGTQINLINFCDFFLTPWVLSLTRNSPAPAKAAGTDELLRLFHSAGPRQKPSLDRG